MYLEDITKCVGKIEVYTKGMTFDEFARNTERQDAVIRRLEIIGEAVKNLPDEVRAKHPNIPWKQIAGMRDILIHEYAGVSLPRVWKAITDDLPPLKSAAQKLLNLS